MLNAILLFIGTTEILVIGGVALLIFGGKKLPELMRSMGKGVKEFKDGMAEGAEVFKEEVNKPNEKSFTESAFIEQTTTSGTESKE